MATVAPMGDVRSLSQSKHVPLTPEQRAAVMAFEAPYVIWKLQLTRNVATEAEAHLLFRETKRYLLVVDVMRPRLVPTFSRRVDEAWHQFVLFTENYAQFCDEFFGRFIHHRPGYFLESLKHETSSYEEFAAAYEAMFGEPPPDLWRDDHDLQLNDRIRYERVGSRFDVRLAGDRAELLYFGEGGEPEVIARVDAWAEPKLRFITRHECFYIRELPGLEDEDKVALARALLSTWEFCLTF